MPQYVCVGLDRRDSTHATELQICKSGTLRGNRLYYLDPTTKHWTLCFRSYDGRGLVLETARGYKFFRVLESHHVARRNLSYRGGHLSYPVLNPGLARGIDKAIVIELCICKDLQQKKNGRFNIYRLPFSGLKSEGTDIVITRAIHPDIQTFTSKSVVDSGICAVEVLGVTNKHGKGLKFTYHSSKNFKKWIDSCYLTNTIPVIAWIDKGICNYMVMSSNYKELYDVFYTKRPGGIHRGFRQRKGYSPVSEADIHKTDGKGLYRLIMWFESQLCTT